MFKPKAVLSRTKMMLPLETYLRLEGVGRKQPQTVVTGSLEVIGTNSGSILERIPFGHQASDLFLAQIAM